MKIIPIIALFLAYNQASWALTITDERGKVEITQHKDWEYEKNLLGLPHVFLTSDKPERSSLSLTLTGLKGVNLPVKELQKNQSQYQDGRKAWAKKHEAEILSFLPYTLQTNAAKVKVHTIGIEYRINQVNYLEKSYYVECPGSFIHLKLLSPKNPKRLIEADEMIQSLKCAL